MAPEEGPGGAAFNTLLRHNQLGLQILETVDRRPARGPVGWLSQKFAKGVMRDAFADLPIRVRTSVVLRRHAEEAHARSHQEVEQGA